MSAQFKNQAVPVRIKVNNKDPFAMMGKPIPFSAQQAGYEHARAMGLDQQSAHAVVSAVSEQLARDQPHEAMAAGMKYLDLIGTYRLFAAILVAAAKQA